MRASIRHIFVTLLAALALALTVGVAPSAAAPDRDEAARAAAMIFTAADLCGQTREAHVPCPFCTLPGSDQPTRASDPRDGALLQDHALRADHQTHPVAQRNDAASPRAPPPLAHPDAISFP